MDIARVGLTREALAGKVAIVTGAGQGVGRATALALAAAGARVVVAEIADTGAETAELIAAAGGDARFIRTDVTQDESVAALAAATTEAFGPADILVNNAIVAPVAPVLEQTVAEFDRTLAVNLRGPFLTCRAFVPGMVARGAGVVVNMVSTDAMPHMAAYIASKRGLEGLSQSLAGEVGPAGVRVIAFGPGFVDTPGLRQAGERLAPELGLSVGEFMHLPLHAGYDGAMPADEAGLAAAYLIAELSDQYHGETVTGYTILEQAGVLRPAEAETVAAARTPGLQGGTQAQIIRRALELSARLSSALGESEAEFGRLPLLVRPLARSGFKSKVGKSLPDWKHAAAELTRRLQWLESGDDRVGLTLLAERGTISADLSKLSRYFREVPAETARFTKDEAVLTEVRRTAGERVATITDLLEALEALKPLPSWQI